MGYFIFKWDVRRPIQSEDGSKHVVNTMGGEGFAVMSVKTWKRPFQIRKVKKTSLDQRAFLPGLCAQTEDGRMEVGREVMSTSDALYHGPNYCFWRKKLSSDDSLRVSVICSKTSLCLELQRRLERCGTNFSNYWWGNKPRETKWLDQGHEATTQDLTPLPPAPPPGGAAYFPLPHSR